MKEKLADRYWKATDEDVIEGGGQGDGVQEVWVLEGSHTFDIGFQSVNSREKIVSKFFEDLE